MKSSVQRLALAASLVITIIVIDQLSKNWAQNRLTTGSPITWLGGIVQLMYSRNQGAIFGLGANLPEWLRFGIVALLVVACLVALVFLTRRSQQLNWLYVAGVACIAGGGASNLIDRILNKGWVIDFIMLTTGSQALGIYNLADIAILCGVILFGIAAMSHQSNSEH